MQSFSVVEGRSDSRVVITCEHASNHIPADYADLGLAADDIADHIGWDIGAAEITCFVARSIEAPAVLSGASRLLIDCNRELEAHDLILTASDGVQIPGNETVDEAERERRISRFYRPYHEAIDDILARHDGALLLSIHSFTPSLRAVQAPACRAFDVGVLFDDHDVPAHRLGTALTAAGLRVRYNEPYSALNGLIYSARSHGARHGRRYLELELNNALLRTAASIESIGAQVGAALKHFLEDECASS